MTRNTENDYDGHKCMKKRMMTRKKKGREKDIHLVFLAERENDGKKAEECVIDTTTRAQYFLSTWKREKIMG